MKKRFTGGGALLTGTLLWGLALSAQRAAMTQMGPFTFQAIRCLLASAFLFAAATLWDVPKLGIMGSLKKWADPMLLRYGCICGGVLFIASSLQQIGIVYTDAGKAGFITSFYIVLVPLLGVFGRSKPGIPAILSLIPGVLGLYLLCAMRPGNMNIGDVFLMASALGFAVQAMVIDRGILSLNGLRFNCLQCLVVCILSLPFLMTEEIHITSISTSWISLTYAGIFAMGIAYTLQVVGKRQICNTAAFLIMSLESVFAALGGWLFLGETMNGRELLGCALIFCATELSLVGGLWRQREGKNASSEETAE